jgi:hypothetical protein
MKVLLTEKQLSFLIESNIDTDLNELKTDEEGHFYHRLHSRWYKSSTLDLVFRVNGEYHKIGYYMVPKEEKDIIDAKINYLIELEKDLDSSLDIGIVVHKFKLSLNSPDVLLTNRTSEAYKKLLYAASKDRSAALFVSDKETKSNGDMLFVGIKQGRLKTIYFGRPSDLNPEKRNSDYILTNPQQIEDI